MAEFKLVLSDPKTGKSYSKEVKDDAAEHFIGIKLGDTIKGEVIDLSGYEFELNGGSDKAGFPMRKDVPGTGRKKILAVSGVGIRSTKKGMRQRKTVCGNTVHTGIAQLNLKITKHGKSPLEEPKDLDKEEPKK